VSAEVWLVRHGETEWSRLGKHTGTTDVALTEAGEAAARELRTRLADLDPDLVVTSPLQRARRTAELAGFPDARVDERLVEWDYGTYEGVTTAEIRRTRPGWSVWTDGAEGGEDGEQVGARIDAALADLPSEGRVLLVAHGHLLRALTARWLGQPVADGRLYRLDTATVSVLGHERETPVILRWNC
jgi:broad specificity phosphatase PhoE